MGALAANLKHLTDLRSDSRTLGDSVSSALETSQVARIGPLADIGSKLFLEQKVLNRPQALPYLSDVVGARAVAAKEEAVLCRHSNSVLDELPTAETCMESAMMSLKNS